MVLDDASPQAGGFGGSPHIRPEIIQKPNILAKYICFGGGYLWRRSVERAIQQRVYQFKHVMHRPPSQEELDSFTEHTSRRLIKKKYGTPLGVVMTYVHTRHEIRKDLGNAPKGLAFEQMIWQNLGIAYKADPPAMRDMAVKIAIRGFLWIVTFHSLTSVLASFQETSAILRDPRLEKFKVAVNQLAEDRQRRIEERRKKLQGVQQGTASAEEPQDFYGDTQTTASDAAYDRNDTFYGGSAEQKESGQIETPTQASSQPAWGRPVQQPAPVAEQGNLSGTNDYFFDDTSPTALEYQKEVSSRGSTSKWERIRQQNTSQDRNQIDPNNPWASIKKNSSPASSSSFPRQQTQANSYSTEEQARQREREVAQKEFDRMLDNERKTSQESGNPSEGSSRGWWRR